MGQQLGAQALTLFGCGAGVRRLQVGLLRLAAIGDIQRSIRETRRLFCGVGLLLLGARYAGLADWDAPVSFLMALPAYFTAPCSLRVALERRWAQLPLALFWTWLTVDGTYTLYWSLVDPAALIFRPANAMASLALYGACGLVWLHRGSLRQLVRNADSLWGGKRRS